MSEPRVTSLLDFAITASVAVLPIMLGVVLVVAVIRPADPTSKLAPGHADRYLSVRHVAALKTFGPGRLRDLFSSDRGLLGHRFGGREDVGGLDEVLGSLGGLLFGQAGGP